MVPSQKELEKLLKKEGGREALVWYAGRNALRTLATLGDSPLRLIWKNNTTGNIYSVVRVNFLLASDFAKAKKVAAKVIIDDTSTKNYAVAATKSASSTVRCLTAMDAIYILEVFSTAVNASNTSAFARFPAYSAARADYEFLIKADLSN